MLFPGPGLPGGGQTEIRMVQSIYTSDPDELDVAQRLRPYDMESWLAEWSRVAEKNERLADGYAVAGLKVTAHEHYRRAQEFWSNATLYLSEHHPQQLPTYRKMREMFDKAWELSRPPFERVKIIVRRQDARGLFPQTRGRGRQEISNDDRVSGRRHDGREHDHGRRGLICRSWYGLSRRRSPRTRQRTTTAGLVSAS